MTLEEEITELTSKWYKIVSFDHHKDRDCHWYVEKIWSYGEEPYYVAYHRGYISETWHSPKCGTEELAQTILRDRLESLIKSEVDRLQTMDDESIEWIGATKEEIDKLIKELI